MSRDDKSTRHEAAAAGNSGVGDAADDAMVRTTLTAQIPTLIFDGECAFCRRCADWVRARRNAPRVVAYQSAPLADWSLRREDCERAVQWIGERRHEGAPAISAVLVHLGAPWSAAGRLIAAPGVRRVAERVYGRIAARRRCRITPPLA